MNPDLIFRDARRDDVVAVVRLLADDDLGARRERFEEPLPARYYDAFGAIDSDPNNRLIVVERAGAVIGCLQLTVIANMSFVGGRRLQIEGVRIARHCRGLGIGERMFRWAIAAGRAAGCHLVQLTANKGRPDALRFYEQLGFEPSHEGLKLYLDP